MYDTVRRMANVTGGMNTEVDVHLAMSVAGGTGSGSFLTIAALIKKLFQKPAEIEDAFNPYLTQYDTYLMRYSDVSK